MGKTEKGAIWIDKDKISAYDFYQGVYQTPDACVEMMFALFTDVPMQEVRKLIEKDIVNAKKVLSYETTKFVRGEEDAIKAKEASEALFKGAGSLDDAPTYTISKKDFASGVAIIDVAVDSKLVSSKSEGKRLIEQNGLMLNEDKVKTFDQKLVVTDFSNGYALLKKGKKSFIKLEVK
jgi:tyrosyl-tRNA synthetase